MQSETVTIPGRFNGPANSGNGGYVCGLLAAHMDGASEVSLRAPPPLEVPLRLTRETGLAQLHDGQMLLA